jgi:hypothetical protein
MAYGAHFLKDSQNGSISPKTMQGLRLPFEQLGQLVGLLMWRGEGQKKHSARSGFVGCHGGLELSPPTFRNLGSAHGTGPNTATGLEASVCSRAVFVVFPHLNVRVIGPDSEALCSTAFG